MSKSPVKIVRVAARAASGSSGGGRRALEAAMSSIPAFERILGLKRNRRAERDRRRRNLRAYKKDQKMSYRDRMRAGAARVQYAAAPVDELSSVIPAVETNNSVDNTLAATQTVAPTITPTVASTVDPATLDPISRQPIGGVQSVPNIQEQTTPEDVATYGVASAAESMFGTPMQRQMSMGSSLMKRACKYKNKK